MTGGDHLDQRHDAALRRLAHRLAQLACDHWRDGPAAREQMHRDVDAVPAHLLGDLAGHLGETYGGRQP